MAMVEPNCSSKSPLVTARNCGNLDSMAWTREPVSAPASGYTTTMEASSWPARTASDGVDLSRASSSCPAVHGTTAVVSKNVSVDARTPMTSNGTLRMSKVSPGRLSNFLARSAPRTTTRRPSSAGVVSRPWAISIRNVSYPWSKPAVYATTKSGEPKPVPLSSRSRRNCTRGAATATPVTSATWSVTLAGIGVRPKAKAGFAASLTTILLSK